MSATGRNWTAGFYATSYWVGVLMALACFALILAGNTEALYRFEHARVPLSWACAAIAILGFLVAEFSPVESLARDAEEERSSSGYPQLAGNGSAILPD